VFLLFSTKQLVLVYVYKNCAIACSRLLREMCIDLRLGLLSVGSGMRHAVPTLLLILTSEYSVERMVIFVCLIFRK